MTELSNIEQQIVDEMLARRPDLKVCVEALRALHDALITAYDNGGKLLVCGNGGSAADAMHIVGELCKSFERKRPLSRDMAERLKGLPFAEELAEHLEIGLPAIALGLNPSLKTAVENDSPVRDIAFAQEAFALLRPGDVLLAISTSGGARNCIMAMSVATALGATAVSLTGPAGGAMAEHADIAIRAPGSATKTIQEAHAVVYHTFCALIEAHYFPGPR
ncbi:MAG TPA: SIS domain-containing protein [Candidatus Hydrogenedentes bacterium]|nr:SIS domain-containing protein [Candidatus Hydrogenedentota bacterium]